MKHKNTFYGKNSEPEYVTAGCVCSNHSALKGSSEPGYDIAMSPVLFAVRHWTPIQ
jgi:hypothetical protein